MLATDPITVNGYTAFCSPTEDNRTIVKISRANKNSFEDIEILPHEKIVQRQKMQEAALYIAGFLLFCGLLAGGCYLSSQVHPQYMIKPGSIAAYPLPFGYSAIGILSASLITATASLYLYIKLQKQAVAAQAFYQYQQRRQQQLDSAFYEFTRRAVNEIDLQSILDKIDDEESAKFAHTFKTIPWDSEHPQYRDKNHLHVALKAFKNGHLTDEQMATAAIFAEAARWQKELKTEDIIQFPAPIRRSVFKEDGTMDAETVELLKSTLYSSHARNNQIMADWQFDLFIEAIKKLPKSEQQILIVQNEKQGSSLSEHIIARRGIQVLGKVHAKGLSDPEKQKYYANCFMVPSGGMMQAFLNVFGGDKAVKINFVLAQSKDEDIRRNGLNNTRDMLIPFPGIANPTIAHGFKVDPLAFFNHDLFHAIVASKIFPTHRKQFIEIGDYLKKFNDGGYGEVVSFFYDLEIIYYLDFILPDLPIPYNNFRGSADESFWAALLFTCQNQHYADSSLLLERVLEYLLFSNTAIVAAGQITENGLKNVINLPYISWEVPSLHHIEMKEAYKKKDKAQEIYQKLVTKHRPQAV